MTLVAWISVAWSAPTISTCTTGKAPAGYVGDDGADLLCSGPGTDNELAGDPITGGDLDVDTLYAHPSAVSPHGTIGEQWEHCGDVDDHGTTWTTGSYACTHDVSSTPAGCDP
jgi:hypothetical protein